MSEKNTNVEPKPEDMREQHVGSFTPLKIRPRLIPKSSTVERGGGDDFGFGNGRR